MLMSFSPVTTSILLCAKPERNRQSHKEGKVWPGNCRNIQGGMHMQGLPGRPCSKMNKKSEERGVSLLWNLRWILGHEAQNGLGWEEPWRFSSSNPSAMSTQLVLLPMSRFGEARGIVEFKQRFNNPSGERLQKIQSGSWFYNGVKKRPLTQGKEWRVPVCWKAKGNRRRCGLINLVILPKIYCRNMRCYWEHTQCSTVFSKAW